LAMRWEGMATGNPSRLAKRLAPQDDGRVVAPG
jgi:hypothetical protein